MFAFGAAPAIDFLPDEETRAWVAEGLRDLVPRLGPPTRSRAVISGSDLSGTGQPHDLDDLFELVCGLQAQVGQHEVEFTLIEFSGGPKPEDKPEIPPGFAPLGNPEGQLMHTFASADEYAVVAVPALFAVPQLVYASVARELGRIAIHRAGGHRFEPDAIEAETELAAVALGLGTLVVNGAYIYENACCGGGCGIDLKSLRTGLSLPESCFALALDGHRRGVSRRSLAKHLAPTQKAALKRSWGFVGKTPALRALAGSDSPRALEGT